MPNPQNAANTLSGYRALVTRPERQAQNLCALLKAKGAQPIALPLIDIAPISESTASYPLLKQHILDLDLFQHIIFVSQNAVEHGANWIDQYWPQLPIGIAWYAIGKKTACCLNDVGIDAYHSPEGYDSEALLNAPQLQNIAGDKVLIVRGEGGRDKLADELSARGALVSYAEVYQRSMPSYSDDILDEKLNPSPDVILISSGEGFENLKALVDHCPVVEWTALQNSHFIVPSERVRTIVSQTGIKRITVAAGPDDSSMVNCL